MARRGVRWIVNRERVVVDTATQEYYSEQIYSYFFARFRLAGLPPGSGLNFSTSERRSNVLPAIVKVVNRPLATRLDIACRLIPLIRAASDCETQSTGLKGFDFDKLVDIVHYNQIIYLCRYGTEYNPAGF